MINKIVAFHHFDAMLYDAPKALKKKFLSVFGGVP
jgi:hypothetical protein